MAVKTRRWLGLWLSVQNKSNQKSNSHAGFQSSQVEKLSVYLSVAGRRPLILSLVCARVHVCTCLLRREGGLRGHLFHQLDHEGRFCSGPLLTASFSGASPLRCPHTPPSASTGLPFTYWLLLHRRDSSLSPLHLLLFFSKYLLVKTPKRLLAELSPDCLFIPFFHRAPRGRGAKK